MKTVGDLLKHLKQNTVFFVSPSNTVIEALDYMNKKDISAVSIVLDDGSFGGIFTERDLARKIVLEKLSAHTTNVEEVMTFASDVISVTSFADLQECFELMNQQSIRHLPVLEDGKLIGMISIRDLVSAIVDQQIYVSEQLESYITGRS
jgi:CBS domain-containing protein